MKRTRLEADVHRPAGATESRNLRRRISELRDLLDNFRRQADDVTDTLEGIGLFGVPPGPASNATTVDFYTEVRRFESFLIRNALRQTRGSQVKAARLLQMHETTLNSKLKTLKIDHRDYSIFIEGQAGDSLRAAGSGERESS
jgi:DNA-binding NtrC family response regulator